MPISNLRKIGDSLTKAFVSEMAPQMLRGILIELFKSKKVTVAKASEWVERNVSLWNSLGTEHQSQLKRLVRKIGDISWVNADWAISSLKDDFPALASLFLGWPKAYNWLGRQLDEIKNRLK